MVALNLLGEVLLPFAEVLQGISHAVQLLTPLNPFPVLRPDVSGNGIQDALVSIAPGDLALLL